MNANQFVGLRRELRHFKCHGLISWETEWRTLKNGRVCPEALSQVKAGNSCRVGDFTWGALKTEPELFKWSP